MRLCVDGRFIFAVCLVLVLVACSSPRSSNILETDGKPADSKPSGGKTAGLADWIPIYPGAKVSGIETHKAGPVETYTDFRIDVSGTDCVKITEWYANTLKTAGFDVNQTAGWTNGSCDAILRSDGPGNLRGFSMNGGGGKDSFFAIRTVVRELEGTAPQTAASVPSWVPRYPGSTPANVVVGSGHGSRVNFSFQTGDDAKRVIGWYLEQLKSAQFTIVSSTVFDANTGQLTAQNSTGRSILTIRMESAGDKRVVAIEAREGVD